MTTSITPMPMHVCSPVRAVYSKLVTLTYSCCPSPWCRYCEELPVEETNEQGNDTSNALAKNTEAKPDVSPILPHKAFPNNATPELPSTDSSVPVSTREPLNVYTTAENSTLCRVGAPVFKN